MNFTSKAASNATQAKIENTRVAAVNKEKISMQAKANSDGQVQAELWAEESRRRQIRRVLIWQEIKIILQCENAHWKGWSQNRKYMEAGDKSADATMVRTAAK